MKATWWLSAIAGAIAVSIGASELRGQGNAANPDRVERVDYLTFAQGAIPVGIGGTGAKLGASFEHAVRMVDGNPGTFSFVSKATAETDTEFTYQLPALTTFDRFAVPGILETPSPAATFTRLVEVHGSNVTATDGYTLLASAALQTHQRRGEVTELPVVATKPVRWIKLRLVGGITILKPESSFEFSEIIGNGSQDTPALVDRFGGNWETRGVRISLRQDGPVVSGCYDTSGVLSGTVSGNILRATGVSQADKTQSAFLLGVADDGELRGVRSSNGGPFRLITSPSSPAGVTVCPSIPPPSLGCGSIIHGISFAYNSAEIRGDSAPVLARLFEGLQADRRSAVAIEGHTSSEGTDDYNTRLSLRRAQAVVADLTRRGIVASRLSAVGIGEARPIASNADESGRSLNRRVEVKCQ